MLHFYQHQHFITTTHDRDSPRAAMSRSSKRPRSLQPPTLRHVAPARKSRESNMPCKPCSFGFHHLTESTEGTSPPLTDNSRMRPHAWRRCAFLIGRPHQLLLLSHNADHFQVMQTFCDSSPGSQKPFNFDHVHYPAVHLAPLPGEPRKWPHRPSRPGCRVVSRTAPCVPDTS